MRIYICTQLHRKYLMLGIYLYCFVLCLTRVAAVLNSNKSLAVDSSFEIDVGILRNDDKGGGRHSLPVTDPDVNSPNCTIKKKHSMVLIPNVEGEYLCLGRAIVTCLAKKGDKRAYKNLIDPRRVNSTNPKSQRSRAIKLYQDAGVPMDRPTHLTEIHKFEEYLKIQIVVVSGNMGNVIVYKGNAVRDSKIFVYLKDEHFHSIIDINAFFVRQKLCKFCLDLYNYRKKHACQYVCRTCCSEMCVYDDTSITCKECNMRCRNAACYIRHKQEREYSVGERRGKPQLSLCDTFYRCSQCTKVLDRTKRDIESHQCGEVLCMCCGDYVMDDHKCYYRIKPPLKQSSRFLYYDYESSQSQIHTCDTGYKSNPKHGCTECTEGYSCPPCRKCVNCKKPYCGQEQHLPVFLVCQTACDQCKNDECTPEATCDKCGNRCPMCDKRQGDAFVKPPCPNGTCGIREQIFKGHDTNEQFCRWLLNPQRKGFVAIAHNARAFDGHFILGYCVQNGIYPNVVYSGSKIMKMTIEQGIGLRFIDSLSHLPLPLRKLPSALKLGTTVRKGDFPHLATCRENAEYVGPYFDASFYGIDSRSSEERSEFLQWHAQKKASGAVFDFQKEMLEYTRCDVAVLRMACMKYRDLIMQTTQFEEGGSCVDPFQKATLAGTAMQILRQQMLYEEHQVTLIDDTVMTGYLKRGKWTDLNGNIIDNMKVKDTKFIKSPIPRIPRNEYSKHTNDSEKCSLWLGWVAHVTNIPIQHGRNGGEYRIPTTRYHVDGYHEPSKTVWEFLGCFFHNCPCQETGLNASEIAKHRAKHESTMLRLNKLRALGYRVVYIWECEFDRMLLRNNSLQEFAKTFKSVTPLKIRDSFFGGRVSPTQLLYETKEDECIRYRDFTSLYPSIMKFGTYCTDHPTIIRENFDFTLKSYFGLIKCTVSPPRGLYIAVLPVRHQKKLYFPLCFTCMEKQQKTPCKHTKQERSILGTWTTLEVQVALEAGYVIDEIYEVHHYDNTTATDNGPGNIFKEYVNCFMKLKQESSGFPEGVNTDEDKKRYVDKYEREEGIRLDIDRVEYNPSLRWVCKLLLNSLWGKFAENTNAGSCKYVNTAAELAQMRNMKVFNITNFHILNDDCMVIEYKRDEKHLEENTFTNLMMATMTTSQARLKLLKMLQITNETTLYFDTDSILNVEKKGQPLLPTGPLLGDLTDEVELCDPITTFLSTGPKSYYYRQISGKEVIKIKGITLNHVNSQVISYDTMKNVLLDERKQIRLPVYKQIRRAKHVGIIYNRKQTKKFQKVFTKRVPRFQDSFDTVPYGF